MLRFLTIILSGSYRRAFLQTHLQCTIIANSPDLNPTFTAAGFVNTEDLITTLTNIINFHPHTPSPVFYSLPSERGIIHLCLIIGVHSLRDTHFYPSLQGIGGMLDHNLHLLFFITAEFP